MTTTFSPTFDFDLEQHLSTGGATVICTDRVDVWQNVPWFSVYQSAISLINLSLKDGIDHALAALDAHCAANKRSVRVIVDGVELIALNVGKEIAPRIGEWILKVTIPKDMEVTFDVRPRSRCVEDILSTYLAAGSEPVRHN